ncbi:MAG: hypothetical protein HOW73_26030 [Polyangiaceae bacterium]|nr:hypothetical protein [Polyangiaceae bacterium]
MAAFAEVSKRFAAFYAANEAPTRPPSFAAHRFALGPGAVSRTARRAASPSRSLADGVADIGIHVRRFAADRRPSRIVVDASAPCALVCAALAAHAELGDGVQVVARARTKAWFRGSEEALVPLADGAVVLVDETDRASAPAVDGDELIGGDEARVRVYVAPYYYVKHELERMARTVALELAYPCPHAERGVELRLARGWEQRAVFAARIEAELATFDASSAAERLQTQLVEAGNALETLEAAERDGETRAAVHYVYPMWRERKSVEAALEKATSKALLAVVNHMPALAWAQGVGASLGPVVVDADQRIVPLARASAARRRARYELDPSVGRALGVLVANWTGL